MVSLDFSIGKIFVGSVSAPIELKSDGAVQLHDADGPILRPLTVLERMQTLRNAQSAQGSPAPTRLASETLQRATQKTDSRSTQKPEDDAIAKALALHLAGADISAPGFKQALTLVSQHFGWQAAEVWNSPAAQFDQIAASLNPANHSGWNQLIMLDQTENGLDALVEKIADDFIKRELEQAFDEDLKEEIAATNSTHSNEQQSNEPAPQSKRHESLATKKSQGPSITFERPDKFDSGSKPINQTQQNEHKEQHGNSSQAETKTQISRNQISRNKLTQNPKGKELPLKTDTPQSTDKETQNKKSRESDAQTKPLVLKRLGPHEDFSSDSKLERTPGQSQPQMQCGTRVNQQNAEQHTAPGTESRKDSTPHNKSEIQSREIQQETQTQPSRESPSIESPYTPATDTQAAQAQPSNVFSLPDNHRKAEKIRPFSLTPESEPPISAKDFFGSGAQSSEFALDQFFESSSHSVAEELAELLNREADQRGID